MKNPANQIAQLRDQLTILENSNTTQPLAELGKPGPLDYLRYQAKRGLKNAVKGAADKPLTAGKMAWEASKFIGSWIIAAPVGAYNLAQLWNDIQNNDTDAAVKHGLNAFLAGIGVVNAPVGAGVWIAKAALEYWMQAPFTDEEKKYCDGLADYYYRTLKRPPKPDDKEIVHIKFFKRVSNTYRELEKEYGKPAGPSGPSGAQAGPSGAAPAAATTTPASGASGPQAAPATQPAAPATQPAAPATQPAGPRTRSVETPPAASGPTEPSTQELTKNAGIPPSDKKPRSKIDW